MDEIVTMEISYCLPLTDTGTDEDSGNPLARALVPLMEMHKQLPSFRLAFLSHGEDGPPSRWLGVFARSPGGRVLFVPGLDVDLFRVRGNDRGVTRFDKEFDLDHVSLEMDRGTWHITAPRSRAHQGGPNAAEVGHGRVFWFGMAIRCLGVLRKAKRRTAATFRVDDRAIQHKLAQLRSAISGGNAVKVPMPARPTSGDWFPLIAVIVGPKDFQLYRGPEFGAPYGSPHVSGEPAVDQRFSISGNQFSLDDTTDVQVATTWIPGSMAIPMILTSPAR